MVAMVALGTLLCAAALCNALGWAAAADPGVDGSYEFRAATTQPDGKVLAAGVFVESICTIPAENGSGRYDCGSFPFVARFGPEGRLDGGFGGDGIAWPKLALHRGVPNAIAVGDQGEITVSYGGAIREGEGGYSALVRLGPDGSPDPGFGNAGVSVLGAPSIPSLLALPGGATLIYANGRSEPENFRNRVLRIRSDGSIDPTFAGEPVAGDVGPVRGPGGTFYLAGAEVVGTYPDEHRELVVERLLSDGHPDPSYGTDGTARIPSTGGVDPFGWTTVVGLGVDPDGEAIISARRGLGYKAGSRPEMMRVSGDGSTAATIAGIDCVGSVAIEPDGGILVAGVNGEYGYYGFCIQRLTAAAVPDGAFSIQQEIRSVFAVEGDGTVLVGGRILQAPGGTLPDSYFARYTLDGLDRNFGLAFLPTLGCRGRNPTEVAEPIEPEFESGEKPTGPGLAKGTAAADVIVGTRGKDLLGGGKGRDSICAGAGRDVVRGGPGGDHIYGGPGKDRLFGGPGHDRLFGGPGRDLLRP
jgi:uncharacterized delta-60 repeat protein